MEDVYRKKLIIKNNQNITNKQTIMETQIIKPEWFNAPWTKADQKIFCSSQHETLCTTRFNNKTYAENKRGRIRLNEECFYANPSPMKGSHMLYVLELNIEENRIMGIGRVPNILHGDVYQIYEDESYNKRYFSGTYRINLEEDVKTEEEKQLMVALESICFRGRGHLKRGHRMLCFPKKIIGQCLQHKIDIISEIHKMFVRKYNNNNNNQLNINK